MAFGVRDIAIIVWLSWSLLTSRGDMRQEICKTLQTVSPAPDTTREIHSGGNIFCGTQTGYYLPELTTYSLAYTLSKWDGDILIVPFWAKNVPDALEITAKDTNGNETVIASTTWYLWAQGKHPWTSDGALKSGANHWPLLICGERDHEDTSTYRLLETSELPVWYTEIPKGVGVLIGHIPTGTQEIIVYVHPNPHAITLGKFTIECFSCDVKMKGLKESYCYDEPVHLSVDVGSEFLNRQNTFEVIREMPDGSKQTWRHLNFAAGTYEVGTYNVKALLSGCVVCEENFTFNLRREDPFSAQLDPLPDALCRTDETAMWVTIHSPAQADLFSVFAPLVDQDTLWFLPQSTAGEVHRFVGQRPLQGYEIGKDLMVHVTLGGCELLLTPKVATCCTAWNAGYFPNAFSPNGDGINEEYHISLAPHHHLRDLQIFDRRGNQVFVQHSELTDLERNGIMRGKQLPPWVYVYYARIQCPDGREIEVAGDVTLVR
jgi:gliding motility-associated-like protein